ncbi:DSHCT domain-containing protein [Colletotrichum higginsianum]|uniref:DSHCT domain-containing protein n=2 Tax=Colletotrichum higginsianum TaxID=80884 RepID=H1V4B4_COLHI|nr:DSHCT domain-containing protein [Colletotrichum higginsianum IMI 349063]OBR06587.1 DSHCT domain-containing protein [Colletotrichum higginsianum IMI 349063]TIC97515.1 ATP-dependent RNA helicase mtr4 [Colletotrichum higginsianum]CCF35066.1 DSHCT domain-containing protein [Colletotrichum higginsianum]
MDELFDVFDAQPGQEQPESHSEHEAAVAEPPKKSRKKDKKSNKRKADGAIKNGVVAEKDDAEMPDADDVPENNSAGNQPEDAGATSDDQEDSHKRRKKEDEAQPVLTDTFQTAQSREVAGATTFTQAQDESLVLSHNIQHQVALPPDLDYEYVPLSEHKPPAEPARKYNFKLDPFQSLSVASIEREESVLVSAHTSAGKTVVAEYAIAQCLKRNQRVIYTSPIKALSNQKYRDFEALFGDVGLMTGDVTINPTASCLVMTTEILRSMLYRGSEIMREVAWVVFDEIHYMRDKTRGVVWEETIILLPDKVRYVFLSATIPNAFQFAEWIAKIHHQACHVVYTDFRPTPLQNYFFPAGGSGIFLVVDEKGVFREGNFQKTMALIEAGKGQDPSNASASWKGKGAKKQTQKGGAAADMKADISKIVRMIMQKSFHPTIIFNFSKKEVENLALQISHFQFNNDSEQAMVKTVFNNAIQSLSEADRELPQIQNLLPLLQKGIGVHHSGLLPILKETIEILFQESLIKVLVATETFSIGLNMPAKTVVFTQVTKWDGTQRRPLTPSEYIQMSGRAGRRGLDSRGIVIMMIDDKMEPDTARAIVVGEQDRLNSAFYLGYNMILNLLRIEAISPEFMLERCFHQFQTGASVPALERDLMSLQQERDNMSIADEATVKDYYNLRNQLEQYTSDMRAVIQHPEHCGDFMQPGRLVRIHDPKKTNNTVGGTDFGWGVVADLIRRQRKSNEPEIPPQESCIIDVMMVVDQKSAPVAEGAKLASGDLPSGLVPYPKPEQPDNGARFEIVPCLLTCVKAISQIRVFMPKDCRSQAALQEVGNSLREVHRRFPDGLPILDPVENMGINDDAFRSLMKKIEMLEARLLTNPLHGSPLLPQLYLQYRAKEKLTEQIKAKKREIARLHSIAQMDELKARKRVLRRLGFLNESEVVELKARVACEISSTEGHELVLAELLFDRFFNELSPELIAATLSCFVLDEKLETAALREELAKPYREVQAKAKQVAKVSRESKLELNEEEYLAGFKWQLMETVYAWAQGKPFAEICKMTNAYEGSLIRLFRRLEELLRQMGQGAKVMGSDELTQKFEDSLAKIRRDIVAAQSLYL